MSHHNPLNSQYRIAADGCAKWTCPHPHCDKELALVVVRDTETYLKLPEDYEPYGNSLKDQMPGGPRYGPRRHPDRHPKRDLAVQRAYSARLLRQQGIEWADVHTDVLLQHDVLTDPSHGPDASRYPAPPKMHAQTLNTYMIGTGRMRRIIITSKMLPIWVDCPTRQHGAYCITPVEEWPEMRR